MTLHEIWSNFFSERAKEELLHPIEYPLPTLGKELSGQRLHPAVTLESVLNRPVDPKLQEVTIKPLISHPGISPEFKLIRFVKLPELLDMLNNHRIVLPRLKSLIECDPFECSAIPSYEGFSRDELIKYAEQRESHAPKEFTEDNLFYFGLSRSRFPKTFSERIQDLSDKQLKEAAWFMEHARLKYDLACKCWYGSSQSSGNEESDAMWKIYCDDVGVAIVTSVQRLKAAVSCSIPKLFKDDFELTLAKIKYDNGLVCKNGKPWLQKRKAFKHENEYRLYVDNPYYSHPGFILKANPRQLIEKIIVSPFSPRWQFETLRQTIQTLTKYRLHAGSKIEIVQSKHRVGAKPSWPGYSGESYFGSLK